MGSRSRLISKEAWLGFVLLCLALVPRLVPLQHGAPYA